MDITPILQIITIAMTLFLGLVTYYQNKKLQHGQNIVSVTTKYRGERSEQLKDAATQLLTNTSAELLKMDIDTDRLFFEAVHASERIGMILHRNFEADKELICLADSVVKAAVCFRKSLSDEALNELLYLQETFRLKCDLYSAAEWNRIKEETKGENTTSHSWIEYHERLQRDFQPEFDRIKETYKR